MCELVPTVTQVRQPLYVLLVTYDRWGMAVSLGGANISVAFETPLGGTAATATMVDHHNGTYSASIVPEWAGQWTVHYTVHAPIGGPQTASALVEVPIGTAAPRTAVVVRGT